MAKKKEPELTDQHVGIRVRMLRMLLNMSQTDLGNAVGITFQQIQKYEKGTNRISSSRLQQFSNILKAPVASFFEGLPDAAKGEVGMSADVMELFSTHDGLTLAKSFMKIKSRKTRREIAEFVDAIATEA